MAGDKVEAAKRRYASGVANELDPDELGRIALIVVDIAREARAFDVARQHAELAVKHYRDAKDEARVRRSMRRLAGALLMLRDWDAALPLIDEIALLPEEREAELPKVDGLKDPKERALEYARALVAWVTGTHPDWTMVWGALMDAFSDDPIAEELERRFTERLGGKKNADLASKLTTRGFRKAAARAAGLGTKSGPTTGPEWAELARAQRASRDLAKAYESHLAAADAFKKSFSWKSNTYAEDDWDEDTRARLFKEDRFDYKGSDHLRDAAECAFRLGDRAKLVTAYDLHHLHRMRGDEKKALARVRALVAEGRKDEALDVVRTELRYDKGGTPELRALFGDAIAAHVAAGRWDEAVGLQREILDANATRWGKPSPAYVVAQLDLAKLLVERGYVGEARPLLEEVSEALGDANHAIARECHDALARVEREKDVELLECVKTARFSTAKERLARMRELLAKGASIATADAAGDTVLHHVARLRAADSGWLTRALIDAGASRTAKNAAGETALDVAAGNSAQVVDAVEALWDKDAAAGTAAIAIASARGNLVTVARLLALGARPDGPLPPPLARGMPEDPGMIEFALRVGDTSLVDAALSGAEPSADDVRRQLVAFAARAGERAMSCRFAGETREKLIAELVYTIASTEILETLVREDWPPFVREDLGLLRASIPVDVDDELGDEADLLAELELAFRRAAFDASPPELRARANRAAFGQPEGEA